MLKKIARVDLEYFYHIIINKEGRRKLLEAMDVFMDQIAVMVSGVYNYLQPHQAAHIKYIQLFVCQPYIKSLKTYIPTQLPLSPIPKIPAATQLPLYQEGKCDGKKVKIERGSCISHFQILQNHKTTLTYCLGKDQVNGRP